MRVRRRENAEVNLLTMRRAWGFAVCGAVSLGAAMLMAGCHGRPTAVQQAKAVPAPDYFKVDPATAGSVSGVIRYTGPRPARKPIDMSSEPACVEARKDTHQGKAYDESLMVGRNGDLANAFVYIKAGLEGKTFAVPSAPVVIDQSGCWFHPRVMGIQVGQVLKVVNSDPVTHNIHPEAVVNREWNHSQGAGDPPIERRFMKPEVMIPVKCNIHSWMHARIGVLDHPYFAVTGSDGSFAIKNLPPGTYTIAVWQEKLGTAEQQITVPPQGDAMANFVLKGK
jgi:plastocyanin